MKAKRVLLMVKVNAVWSLLDEFHEYWKRVNLPDWEKHGAKHIGSYTGIAGAPINQITRLFEFEDLQAWENFHEWLFGTKFQEVDKDRTVPPDSLMKYIIDLEQRLFVSVY